MIKKQVKPKKKTKLKTWGGLRPNAGRKPNTGKFKEPTRPIRVPVRLIDKIMEFILLNLN